MVDRATLLDAHAEVAEFVSFQRELEGIKSGTTQPDGLGFAWNPLEQRVYGTFVYAQTFEDLLAECKREFTDLQVMVETLVYIRSELPRVRAQVAEKRRKRQPVA